MRILFAEEGDGVGGSVISLYYLLRGLIGRGVRPVVVFPAPHAWSERYERLGVEILYRQAAATGLSTGSGSAGATGAAPGVNSPAPAWTESPIYRRISFYKRYFAAQARESRAWRVLLEQVRPDAVYGNNDLPLNFGMAAAARDLGLPVYCHLRGFQPLRAPHRRFRNRMRAGIAISEVVRQHYLRAGFPPERIQRVYNGLDVADYPYREPRAEVPVAGGRLLFLGRLTGWKGAPVLLEAVARLRTKRPELTLVIAGDGPARAAWEGDAARLGLADACRFAGFVSDAPRLFHEADIMIHASTEPEPFGRVLIEGMACGTPVVASRLGATGEIIEDGQSGALVPPGRPELLADTLHDLLGAGPRRVTMARSARRRVEEQFTVERMVDGVARVLGLSATGGAAA